jgi:hypothetical protein
MTEAQRTQQDPTQQYQQPEQELEHSGLESEMQPKPTTASSPTVAAAG